MSLDFKVPELPNALIRQAYEQAASRNVLAAMNPKVFFGYISVCADGIGHGNDSTFPGLDWGQTAEALLWLGRTKEVLASWEYVKSFQRPDGRIPFAIFPSNKGKSVVVREYVLQHEADGAVFEHWIPGDPLRALAPVTYLRTADEIFRHTGDRDWLQRQAASMAGVVGVLERLVTQDGLVAGGGFYMERPTRLEYDGISQGAAAHVLKTTAGLFEFIGDAAEAERTLKLQDRVSEAFRNRFWAGEQCFEYIDPVRGPIEGHGLTDVDWLAVATGVIADDRRQRLWQRLKDEAAFNFGGVPTAIATKPETYADWEFSDPGQKHDLSAMGRVWYLEAWARHAMGDGDGIVDSLRRVAEAGRANDWYWHERYYAEQTGNLAEWRIDKYLEYPVCLIRIVNEFLMGIRLELDGSLSIAPVVPKDYWKVGFGHAVRWQGRSLTFRFEDGAMQGQHEGATPLRLRVRFPSAEGQFVWNETSLSAAQGRFSLAAC